MDAQIAIRGGSVIDGTGAPARRADIGIADGRIKKGDLVMFEAMGGGFTWGASVVRM